MNHEVFQSEAIVLDSLRYKERDKILTLFTKERGVLKLFVKGKLLFHHALTEPFTVGNYLYNQGRGELLQFCDGEVVEQNLALRSSWEVLHMAEKCVKAVSHSQWQGKQAPELYGMLLLFLRKIQEGAQDVLLTAFLLKVLKHEGVLQRQSFCSSCQKSFNEGFRYSGERYCHDHAPKESLFFDMDEEESLRYLYSERQFENILTHTPPKTLLSKLETLFAQIYDY